MSHSASAAIQTWQSGQAGAINTTLDAGSAAQIRAALEIDALGLIYSASISFSEAIAAIPRAQFSWATVKLYYSAFYSARAILAAHDVAIIHESNPPYSLKLWAGQKLRKEQSGGTHVITWNIFKRELSHSPLLGQVNSVVAHEWVKALRVQASYKNAQFPDPTVPTHFAEIDLIGLDAALTAYAADSTFLYAFDPDHAAIAFPLECLKSAYSTKSANIALDPLASKHLSSCVPQIPSVRQLLSL